MTSAAASGAPDIADGCACEPQSLELTAVSLADASLFVEAESSQHTSEHLSWASIIKDHHRHLQMAVPLPPLLSEGSVREVEKMTSPACAAPHQPSPTPRYQLELKAWQSAVSAEKLGQELSTYASAMHHLATRYWDTAVPSPQAAVKELYTTPHPGLTPMPGTKRLRSSDGPSDVSVISLSKAATKATVAAALPPLPQNPRHYSDRLQYCLRSATSYYLGEAEVQTCDGPPMDSASVMGPSSLPDSSCAAEAHRTILSSFMVRIEDTTFRKLPSVFARVIKPLRRLFFQRYGRMATAVEVEHLLAACTPFTPSYSMSEQACEADLVEDLIRSDAAACAIVAESSWRRARGTAWATGWRYTCQHLTTLPASTASESSPFSGASASPAASSLSGACDAPPPLWVLDVGSCYGPFHGKALHRTRPLPPVPLRVTSVDLAPYVEASEAEVVYCDSETPPTPRVWQADWLRLDFFRGITTTATAAANEGKDEGDTTESVGEAFSRCLDSGVGTAEEGRLRYRYAPHGGNTDTKEDGGVTTSHGNRCVQGDGGKRLSVTALQLESYDAVFFCLLLSYMPTPRLRFLACLHALLALKEGGLLVVVSTRTQGPRRTNWMMDWTASLATIGFQRVEQSVQEKIIGMSFAKVAPSADVRESWSTKEGREAWVHTQMTSPVAERGLRIIADDRQGEDGEL